MTGVLTKVQVGGVDLLNLVNVRIECSQIQQTTHLSIYYITPRDIS